MAETEAVLPPRLPKPESLEAKFKLSIGLPYDLRAKRKHMLVYGFILDWFHSKYGDALASVRHVVDNIKERDPAKKGLSIPHVHSALADLVEWGYLTQDKGAGKRASRYIPVWDLVCKIPSVTPVGNNSDSDPSVTPGVNTAVTPGVNTTSDSVTNGGNEDPSTVTRPQDRVNEIDGHDCATPTAPLSAGLAAADAVAAQGFEELRRAYYPNKAKDIKKARKAYDKLAPDDELHVTMLESAATWYSAWAAQGKPDAPRHSLERWILDERYLEDPPAAYQPKERKAKTASVDKPVSKSKGIVTDQLRILDVEFMGSAFADYRLRIKLDGPSGEQEHVLKVLSKEGVGEDNDVYSRIQAAFSSTTDDWPGQRLRLEMNGDRVIDVIPERMPDRVVSIESADLIDTGEEKIFVAKITDQNGKPEGKIELVYESDDQYEQTKGQKKLADLCRAVDLPRLSDTDELLFKPFLATSSGDFRRAPVEMGKAA
ncbi:MAG: hypothetical protein EOS04_33185 [Mesorhizobium sp.]|nr:MAG: hypothetical protein EOS04_33185 [Mesorhizobium sp.]